MARPIVRRLCLVAASLVAVKACVLAANTPAYGGDEANQLQLLHWANG